MYSLEKKTDPGSTANLHIYKSTLVRGLSATDHCCAGSMRRTGDVNMRTTHCRVTTTAPLD